MRPAIWIVIALFLGSVVGAWAWFHIAPPPATDYLTFEVRRSMDDWQFASEPVGAKAEEILATTNLLNGVYASKQGDHVTAFAASWKAADSRSMSVVHHTPDICWVGAGWKTTEVGQPSKVEIEFEAQAVPFECRVFVPPGGTGKQLVLWCTLVGGSIVEESRRWTSVENLGGDARDRAAWGARRVAANQFLRNIAGRRAGLGEKQFVRFSASMSGDDWPSAVGRLERFAHDWLAVRR